MIKTNTKQVNVQIAMDQFERIEKAKQVLGMKNTTDFMRYCAGQVCREVLKNE